jgi:hypothetical protein
MRSRQPGLFAADQLEMPPSSFEVDLKRQQTKAAKLLSELLDAHPRIKYEEILGDLLELPLVWPNTVQALVQRKIQDGGIEVEGGLKPREKTIKNEHLIRKR